MLSRNCLIILRKLNSYAGSVPRFSIDKIAEMCNLTAIETQRAVDFLIEERYLKYYQPTEYLSSKQRFENNFPVELTEMGVCYKAIRRRQVLDYIADKWVDFFALLVSFVSAIISLIAILR